MGHRERHLLEPPDCNAPATRPFPSFAVKSPAPPHQDNHGHPAEDGAAPPHTGTPVPAPEHGASSDPLPRRACCPKANHHHVNAHEDDNVEDDHHDHVRNDDGDGDHDGAPVKDNHDDTPPHRSSSEQNNGSLPRRAGHPATAKEAAALKHKAALEQDDDDDDEEQEESSGQPPHADTGGHNYTFSAELQDQILASYIAHPDEFAEFGALIKPAFFNGPAAMSAVFALMEYMRKYGQMPNYVTLGDYAFKREKRTNLEAANDVYAYVQKLAKIDTSNWRSDRDMAGEFAHDPAIKDAIAKCAVLYEEELEGCVNESFSEILAEAEAVGRTRRAVISTVDDVLAASSDPPEHLIEGLLPLGGLMVIAGRAKSQKTWTAIEAALSVAAGKSWLGFNCKQEKTVFVNFELSKEELEMRIKVIAAAKGINMEDLRNWFIGITFDTDEIEIHGKQERHENLFAAAVMQDIKREVRKAMPGAKFLFLDSFYNLCGNINENDASEVKLVYRYVRRMSKDLGATTALVHHFSKGDPGTKMEGERGAGSRVHRQQPNAYIEFTPLKEEDALSVHADLRSYKLAPDFSLRWEFPLLVSAPDLDPKDIKTTKTGPDRETSVADILMALMEGPLTRAEWFTAVLRYKKTSESTFDRRRREARKASKVVCEAGYWRLVTNIKGRASQNNLTPAKQNNETSS